MQNKKKAVSKRGSATHVMGFLLIPTEFEVQQC